MARGVGLLTVYLAYCVVGRVLPRGITRCKRSNPYPKAPLRNLPLCRLPSPTKTQASCMAISVPNRNRVDQCLKFRNKPQL
jgi:hypothetical protein